MTSASSISAQRRHWPCIRWPLENHQRHLLLPSESHPYSLAQSISRKLSWPRSYAQSASGLLNRWEQSISLLLLYALVLKRQNPGINP